jgi:hypothetical protein
MTLASQYLAEHESTGVLEALSQVRSAFRSLDMLTNCTTGCSIEKASNGFSRG